MAENAEQVEELKPQVATPDPATAPSEPADTPADDTENQPEGKETPTQVEPAKPKLHTQEELDAIVQREKAKAEARAERRAEKAYRGILESLVPKPQQPAAPASGRPTQAQYADFDDYVEALADWKFTQRDQEVRKQAQEQHARALTAKTEAHYQKAQELPGFDREAFDSLPLTQVIAAAVTDSDIAPRLMAYMAANPDEVHRIAQLSPARQAAEIGKMETKVTAAPAVPKPSSAPAPIAPIGASGGGTKDPSEMTEAEHAAWRRKRIAQRR